MTKHIALTLSVAIALFSAAIARAEDHKVDGEGFIRNWLLLAPIALGEENAGGEHIDKQQIPNEGSIKPKEGETVKVGDKNLVWKNIKTPDYFFDINEILGNPTEDSAVYAVAYIVADAEMKGVQLHMGSNDQGKAYLNGKEVVKFAEGRTLDKDSDKAENLTLNKGVNVVVFKVINDKNNFQGCIRFKDSAGKVLTGLKVRLEP